MPYFVRGGYENSIVPFENSDSPKSKDRCRIRLVPHIHIVHTAHIGARVFIYILGGGWQYKFHINNMHNLIYDR